jgi:gluconolactonase
VYFDTVATGLEYPEGPISMPDGTFLVVEIKRGALTRIYPDGAKETIAKLGGGPNGIAIGPDGYCFVCNNGGFDWHTDEFGPRPTLQPSNYSGGRIEKVDLNVGSVDVLYTEADGIPLSGPNDIVFDAYGGFYFTDLGKTRRYDQDKGRVMYALPDGSNISTIIHPIDTPNGIGLSDDGKLLYVSETAPARLWAFEISSPGTINKNPWPSPHGGRFVAGSNEYQKFDSLALESSGNICVATLINGGISVVSPDGGIVEHVPFPDRYTTNICFGGAAMTTAYITLSQTGRLIAADWPRSGLALTYP